MRTQRKPRKHFSPRLLELEDRIVPVTFTVTTNAGGAVSGSLATAIIAANKNLTVDTIVFNSFFDTPQTIALTVGELSITQSLTITGPAGGVTISGNNAGRVFNIDGTGNMVVGMSDLTITGGKVTGVNQGGGILIADETVTLTRCTVSNNTTASAGGGVTVVGGSLTVQDSTFSGNIASAAAGLYFNGVPLAGGFTVRNSTFSGNSATVSIGGGISLGLGFNGTCKIQNSTITANSAKSNGGGLSRSQFSTGLYNLESSIVSGNLSNGTGDDISNGGTVTVNFSAIGDSAGFTLSGANNLAFGTNLKLGSLATNGGPTLTHLPTVDSPLKDKGSNPAGLTFDQRGIGYARSLNAVADIGAIDVVGPLVVKNTNDSGIDSLRQQILDADSIIGANTITFDPAVFSTAKTITLLAGQLQVTGSTTIVGPAGGVTVSGNKASRVFSVSSNFVLSDMTITDGSSGLNGGGISIATATAVTLTRVKISNCSGDIGGGIHMTASGPPSAQLTMMDCTIADNSASSGGGISIHNIMATLTGCTISGNTSSFSGGGIHTAAAATQIALNLKNCTITGNITSGVGGGISAAGNAGEGGLLVQNSTITGNSAVSVGGGIQYSGPSGFIQSSIVSGNKANSGGADVSAAAPVVQFSAIGDPNGFALGGSSANNLAYGTVLKLGPLADNGGPTLTHLPAADSPLIDAGSNSAGLTLDQRGVGFPRVIGSQADIGAIEGLNLVVRNTNDSGYGSLRQTILHADTHSGDDTITFDPNVVAGGDATIGLTTFDTGLDPGEVGPTAMTITSPVTILGPTGSNGVTIERSAAANFRLFHVTSTGNLTLENLTLKNGNASGFSGGGGGGLVDGTVDSGGGGGGSAGLGGAIYNEGAVIIRQSTMMGNQAIGGAGAGRFSSAGAGAGGGGGGLGVTGAYSPFSTGAPGGGPNGGTTLTLPGFGGGGAGGTRNTPFIPGDPGQSGEFGGGGGGGAYGQKASGGKGGSGGFGGGGGGGGGVSSGLPNGFGGTSLFAGGKGGGVFASEIYGGGGGGAGLGGAIFNYGGTVSVINSTFSGNAAQGGAEGPGETSQGNGFPGEGLGGAIFSRNGSVTITSSTFAGNTADQGGGSIFGVGDGAAVTVNLNSALLANTSGTASDFQSAAINGGSRVFAGADNLIESNAGGGNGFTGGIAVAADPLLLPLTDNGGPTRTHVLSPISPAIDKGSNAAGLATDQRGAGFSRVIGVAADIGAVEDTSPTVSGIVVNGGAAQRSRITSIAVTFSASLDVTLFQNPGAVTLTRTAATSNGTIGTVVTIGSGLQITPGAGNATAITLTFQNLSNSGVQFVSLADGRWQLAIPSLGYTSTLNDPNLRRLYGDGNNDGTVDGNDLAAFGALFGSSGPSTVAFDFNNDLTIDALDFGEFGNRFGVTL